MLFTMFSLVGREKDMIYLLILLLHLLLNLLADFRHKGNLLNTFIRFSPLFKNISIEPLKNKTTNN